MKSSGFLKLTSRKTKVCEVIIEIVCLMDVLRLTFELILPNMSFKYTYDLNMTIFIFTFSEWKVKSQFLVESI